MKYEATTKVFVCIGGYQDIDDECIKIPENKYWVKELSRFNCVEGFFEL